jgi:hypothetical protein
MSSSYGWKSSLQLPQINDKWIMKILEVENYGMEELIQLNTVRCYQQVIFLSDIMDASGRAIDEKYLRRQPLHKNWSTLVFPQERPSPQDFQLWEEALVELTQQRGIRQWMVGISEKGHDIWEWG